MHRNASTQQTAYRDHGAYLTNKLLELLRARISFNQKQKASTKTLYCPHIHKTVLPKSSAPRKIPNSYAILSIPCVTKRQQGQYLNLVSYIIINAILSTPTSSKPTRPYEPHWNDSELNMARHEGAPQFAYARCQDRSKKVRSCLSLRYSII